MLQLAKLSSKSQITVPVEVRKTLHLKTSDTLAWEVQEGGKISVRRVEPVDIDYITALSGTLSEWSSAEDDEAYRVSNRYDIVKVPFPFTDRQANKYRPALIISSSKLLNNCIGHYRSN